MGFKVFYHVLVNLPDEGPDPEELTIRNIIVDEVRQGIMELKDPMEQLYIVSYLDLMVSSLR